MKLLLFDIDGTLIHPGGAAIKAINRVFNRIYRTENAMGGIRPDGKTDPIILRELFNANLGRDCSPEEAEKVYREYTLLLEEEISNSKDFTIMCGVNEILEVISKRPDIKLGIATGNIEEGAWIKLGYCGLDSYFKFGAFGSDSEDRGKIIGIAIERGMKLYNNGKRYEEVFVIGDTPLDIIHGRAAGTKVLAVATGSYSLESLNGYNPDHLIENFSDIESVIEIFIS